jgi:transposase
MAVTHSLDSRPSVAPVLYIAFELSSGQWKLASSTARGQRARLVSVPARDTARVLREIARAKTRFGLPENTAVVSCYEAGRDGFWLHRFLHQHGINNVIVDSSSIEVNRRLRRAKADSLDAASLVALLIRYSEGETRVWSTVAVPDSLDEDQRHLHRELDQLRRERTSHSNRVRGLLAAVGVKISGKYFSAAALDALRQWNGEPVPEGLKRRLLHSGVTWRKGKFPIKPRSRTGRRSLNAWSRRFHPRSPGGGTRVPRSLPRTPSSFPLLCVPGGT